MSASTSSSVEDISSLANDTVRVTGSEINYYMICKRKLWLFSHNIELEPESDLVKLGRLLHENRYKRKLKEVQIDRIKVDFMEMRKTAVVTEQATTSSEEGTSDVEPPAEGPVTAVAAPTTPKQISDGKSWIPNLSQTIRPQKEIVIHEVKRSKKMQDAHLYQLLYYMYYLKTNYNVNVLRGVLHYPLLNQNVEAVLNEDRVKQIEEALRGIREVNSLENPPEAEWKRYCRSCAYCDLCWC